MKRNKTDLLSLVAVAAVAGILFASALAPAAYAMGDKDDKRMDDKMKKDGELPNGKPFPVKTPHETCPTTSHETCPPGVGFWVVIGR